MGFLVLVFDDEMVCKSGISGATCAGVVVSLLWRGRVPRAPPPVRGDGSAPRCRCRGTRRRAPATLVSAPQIRSGIARSTGTQLDPSTQNLTYDNAEPPTGYFRNLSKILSIFIYISFYFIKLEIKCDLFVFCSILNKLYKLKLTENKFLRHFILFAKKVPNNQSIATNFRTI